MKDLYLENESINFTEFVSKTDIEESQYLFITNFTGVVGTRNNDGSYNTDCVGLAFNSLEEALEEGYWAFKCRIRKVLGKDKDSPSKTIMDYNELSDRAKWLALKFKFKKKYIYIFERDIREDSEENKKETREALENILATPNLNMTKAETELVIALLKTDLSFKRTREVFDSYMKVKLKGHESDIVQSINDIL